MSIFKRQDSFLKIKNQKNKIKIAIYFYRTYWFKNIKYESVFISRLKTTTLLKLDIEFS